MFSQDTTTNLVDQVVADHAVDVVTMKENVEEMWKTTSSKRERRALASAGTPGVSFYGDNIGIDNIYVDIVLKQHLEIHLLNFSTHHSVKRRRGNLILTRQC